MRLVSASRLATCPDIHIFWVQACGEALGKSDKALIAKDFPLPQQGAAKRGQADVREPASGAATISTFSGGKLVEKPLTSPSSH
jgi:hypothetical protein